MGLPDDDLEYTNDGTTGLPDEAATDAGYGGAGTEDAGTEDAGTEVADAASGTEAPEAVPANELTGSYDHLWDKTVMRRIEDAAVRDEPEEELGDQPGVEPDGPEESADGHGDQQEAAAQEPSQGDAQPPFHAQPPVPACCARRPACLLRP